ncbi:MAG: phosphoglucosamine mutase [Firmicutes bacterium]|nr:phosphoglucosamine mutase [Bacillota bacterium]
MTRLFGTDGVRGVANRELTPELAFQLGFAATRVLATETEKTFVVGRDTRVSGDLLECALCAGVMSAGGDVWRLGVIPTPGVAYVTRTSGSAAGIMISASHNPMEDNGIKFFGADGFKLLDAIEDEMETQMTRVTHADRPTGAHVGRLHDHPAAVDAYMQFLRGTVRHRFDGMKVVVDAANGAAYEVAPLLLRSLGADVTVISANPDGTNINVHCGSTHPEMLAEQVRETGADVGLAFDGDADRLIAVDAAGHLVDGDRIMLICARDLQSRGALRAHTLVTTVMSNYGFVKAAREQGIELVRTAVGDRYVMEAMRDGGYTLGGEQSGHVIFLQHNTTGDGVLTGLQLLDAMVDAGQPLEQLAGIMRSYPQALINIRVRDKTAWRRNDAVGAAIQEVEAALGDEGRVLVRESGTEPVVRVMVEAPDEMQVQRLAAAIADVVRTQLGA